MSLKSDRSLMKPYKCALTLAVSVEIEDTAGSHHRLQGDDLIQGHSE